MDMPDQQPDSPTHTDFEATVVPMLQQMRSMLADIGLVTMRIEGKLDGLLEALAEERDEEAEEGESDFEQTTLDGDVMGAERDESQPL